MDLYIIFCDAINTTSVGWGVAVLKDGEMFKAVTGGEIGETCFFDEV